MADDGEIDVMGDFDFRLEAASEMYDANELPSKSANLLPEYTNPPWMLEQGWNLDMDEKSKATIEKMLLEEQQYLGSKTSKQRRNLQSKLLSATGKSDNSTAKRFWTDQEKQMLLKGMEIYGRSWTKIAELIPTRTSIQIKSFANQYFKAKVKEKQMSSTPSSSSVNEQSDNPLLDTLSKVSGAKPTITVRNIIIPSKGRIPKATNSATDKHTAVKSGKFHKKKSPAKTIKSAGMRSELSKILLNGHSDVADKVESSCPASFNVAINPTNHKVTITPNLIENLDGFCAVTDIVTTNGNDTNEDDDIDIENDDDDGDCNPILQSRSTSPNSVYEKLVSEANIKKSEHQKHYSDNDESETTVKNKEELTESASAEKDISKDSMKLNGTDKEMIPEGISDEIKALDVPLATETAKESKVEIKRIEAKEDANVLRKSDKPSNKVKQEPVKKIYVNAVTTVEGEVIHFPIPTSERVFSPSEVSDEERTVHPEFFENRSSKTPERYLRIRNYITESWKKCKPNYLNKTSVRPGLKNCGDVNCIGRIHAYLECIGAINFGCDQASYNVPKSHSEPVRKEKVVKELTGELNVAKLEAMRPRKRKVRDAFGYWIDEKELEGKTIQHSELLEEAGYKPQKPKQIKSGYDPFKLVPCQSFTADCPAPFQVEVHKSALIVMDIHAHISKTEVIGMLGGKYCKEWGKLTVSMATPCNSISTGMQCEMDPVSQTQASEEIRSAGLKVIGWYHSHPVFDPNPSVRDMETQLKFQEWFAKGGSNFVGVIVSPYNPRNTGLGSEFNCLTVREIMHPDLICNTLVPYKFEFTTRDSDVSEISNLILTAQDLATSYSTYRNRVDLTSIYRRSTGLTCLDKLIESVKLTSPGPDSYLEELLDSVRKAFSSTDSVDFTDTVATDDLGGLVAVKGEPR